MWSSVNSPTSELSCSVLTQAFCAVGLLPLFVGWELCSAEVDERHLSDTLQHLDRAFAEFHLPEDDVEPDLRHVAQQILPADDSSLQWSPAGGGITDDPAETLNHLFQRFVQQHHEAVAASR